MFRRILVSEVAGEIVKVDVWAGSAAGMGDNSFDAVLRPLGGPRDGL